MALLGLGESEKREAGSGKREAGSGKRKDAQSADALARGSSLRLTLPASLLPLPLYSFRLAGGNQGRISVLSFFIDPAKSSPASRASKSSSVMLSAARIAAF